MLDVLGHIVKDLVTTLCVSEKEEVLPLISPKRTEGEGWKPYYELMEIIIRK